jgi:hypothetical protein
MDKHFAGGRWARWPVGCGGGGVKTLRWLHVQVHSHARPRQRGGEAGRLLASLDSATLAARFGGRETLEHVLAALQVAIAAVAHLHAYIGCAQHRKLIWSMLAPKFKCSWVGLCCGLWGAAHRL